MKYKNRNLYIVFILLIVFGISIGYAVINRNLTITGNSEVKQNTWDIHFDNIQVTPGSVSSSIPTLDNVNLSVNFNFMLNLPGDFYEFTVDVVNRGTIDAMIDSITKTPQLTETQQKYLNYIIEYQNGEQIQTNQLVENKSYVRFKVRVEYRSDINENDLPNVEEALNLGFSVKFVQADLLTSTVVEYNGILAKNGSLDDIGTIVTIGSEKFYTIGTDGENVKLLAMHNLLVGSESVLPKDEGDEVLLQELENPTGLQNSKATGAFMDLDYNTQTSSYNEIVFGVTPFSNDGQKGINYSDYSGSIVEKYVNTYKSTLEEKFNIEVVDSGLVTLADLFNSNTFACSQENHCLNSPYPWVYSTTYWLGSASDSGHVLAMTGGVGIIFPANCLNGSATGVRPVIVISKSYFN